MLMSLHTLAQRSALCKKNWDQKESSSRICAEREPEPHFLNRDSHDDVVDQFAVDVRKAAFDAVVIIGEAFVIDPQ